MEGTGVPVISSVDIGNDQMTNDIRVVIGPSLEILIFYELFVAVSTLTFSYSLERRQLAEKSYMVFRHDKISGRASSANRGFCAAV